MLLQLGGERGNGWKEVGEGGGWRMGVWGWERSSATGSLVRGFFVLGGKKHQGVYNELRCNEEKEKGYTSEGIHSPSFVYHGGFPTENKYTSQHVHRLLKVNYFSTAVFFFFYQQR